MLRLNFWQLYFNAIFSFFVQRWYLYLLFVLTLYFFRHLIIGSLILVFHIILDKVHYCFGARCFYCFIRCFFWWCLKRLRVRVFFACAHVLQMHRSAVQLSSQRTIRARWSCASSQRVPCSTKTAKLPSKTSLRHSTCWPLGTNRIRWCGPRYDAETIWDLSRPQGWGIITNRFHKIWHTDKQCDNYNLKSYRWCNNIVLYEFIWIHRTCDFI